MKKILPIALLCAFVLTFTVGCGSEPAKPVTSSKMTTEKSTVVSTGAGKM